MTHFCKVTFESAFAKASDFASAVAEAMADEQATPDKSADKIGFVLGLIGFVFISIVNSSLFIVHCETRAYVHLSI